MRTEVGGKKNLLTRFGLGVLSLSSFNRMVNTMGGEVKRTAQN